MPRINGLAAGVPVSSYGANSNINTNGGNRKQGIASTTNIRSRLFFPIRSRTHQSDPNYTFCNRINALSGGVGRLSGPFVPGAGGIGETDTYGCWIQEQKKVHKANRDRQLKNFEEYTPSQIAALATTLQNYKAFATAFETEQNDGETYTVALAAPSETLVTDGVREALGPAIDRIQHLGTGSSSPAWLYLNNGYAGTDPSKETLLNEAAEIKALGIEGIVKRFPYTRKAYNANKNNPNYVQSLEKVHELALMPPDVAELLKNNGYGFNVERLFPSLGRVMIWCFGIENIYCTYQGETECIR